MRGPWSLKVGRNQTMDHLTLQVCENGDQQGQVGSPCSHVALICPYCALCSVQYTSESTESGEQHESVLSKSASPSVRLVLVSLTRAELSRCMHPGYWTGHGKLEREIDCELRNRFCGAPLLPVSPADCESITPLLLVDCCRQL